jgi:hypothetical protein
VEALTRPRTGGVLAAFTVRPSNFHVLLCLDRSWTQKQYNECLEGQPDSASAADTISAAGRRRVADTSLEGTPENDAIYNL